MKKTNGGRPIQLNENTNHLLNLNLSNTSETTMFDKESIGIITNLAAKQFGCYPGNVTQGTQVKKSEIESFIDDRLRYNMSMFEKVITSIIDHKLTGLGLIPTKNNITSELIQSESDEIVENLLRLPYIQTIAYSKDNSDIELFVVHTNQDPVKALEDIVNIVIELEDKLPEYFPRPWIFHTTEVDPSHLEEARIIFSRS